MITVQRQLGKKPKSRKEDFAPKTFTKQEVRLKTDWSYRVLPDQEAEDKFREELLEIVVDTGKYLGAAS